MGCLVFGEHFDSSPTTESIGTQTERKKGFSSCACWLVCRNADTVITRGLPGWNFSREAEEWGTFNHISQQFCVVSITRPLLQSRGKLLCKTRPNHSWELNSESPIGPLGVPSGFASTEWEHRFWIGRNWEDVFKFWSHLVIHLSFIHSANTSLGATMYLHSPKHWRYGMGQGRQGAYPDGTFISKADTVGSIRTWFGSTGEMIWTIVKGGLECIWNERVEKPVEKKTCWSRRLRQKEPEERD